MSKEIEKIIKRVQEDSDKLDNLSVDIIEVKSDVIGKKIKNKS